MRPSCPRRRRGAWSVIALSALLPAAATHAQTTAPRDLLLEVYINGSDTEKVGSFLERGGRIFATADELRALGLVPPPSASGGALVDVADIVSEPAVVDERAQSISLKVAIKALAVQQIGERPAASRPTDPSPSGLLVNYDVTTTARSGAWDAYGLGSMRMFGRLGTLQSDFSVVRAASVLRAVRLNTTYSYSDADRLRTYSVGDVLSAALPYTRSIRIGGAQMSTNFALRPDLVTYPVPSLNGGAAVPSTVDVFVNGVRQLSTRVDAGPFSVPQLPVISGAGQVSIAVRDQAGHQTVQTSSFYLSSALLRPGLSSYSVEAGAVRGDFGLKSGGYGPLAVAVTARHGVSSALTLEGHAEGSASTALATGGATLALGTLAVASAALGVSRSPGGTGSQAYVAVERTARSYHLGFSALASSRRFVDLGALVGDVPPRHVVQANAGMVFGRQGSLGIAYTDIAQRASKRPVLPGATLLRPASRTAIASATYSREVFGRAYVHLTGYGNLRSGERAVSAGISVRFGGRGSIGTSYESASRQAVVEASMPAIDPGDIGWRGYATQGSDQRALGEIYYRASGAELALGVDSNRGATAVQAAARGSLVIMAGSIFATTPISDGFAVVDTQGFGNVAVTLNNRPAGRTGRRGKLLVPGVASYQSNTISIDPGDLPLNTRWERLDATVSTAARAGAVARFGVQRQHDVLLTIRFGDGVLPVGSRIAVEGSKQVVESGYDGQAYFPDLAGHHKLKVTLPDETTCSADVAVPSGSISPIMIDAQCK